MINFSMIVAVSSNNVIGYENQLPWYIPEDLKYFKEKTLFKKVIMGRRTFESMDKPLPNRTHIIISSTIKEKIKDSFVFSSLKEAIQYFNNQTITDEEIFIIGGSYIFKEALELDILNKLFITKIHKQYQGDTYLPEIPYTQYRLIANQEIYSKNESTLITFEEYVKIS